MLNRFPCFCDGWKFIEQNSALCICGSLMVVLSFTVDWQLSTLLKCSLIANNQLNVCTTSVTEGEVARVKLV